MSAYNLNMRIYLQTQTYTIVYILVCTTYNRHLNHIQKQTFIWNLIEIGLIKSCNMLFLHQGDGLVYPTRFPRSILGITVPTLQELQ